MPLLCESQRREPKSPLLEARSSRTSLRGGVEHGGAVLCYGTLANLEETHATEPRLHGSST